MKKMHAPERSKVGKKGGTKRIKEAWRGHTDILKPGATFPLYESSCLMPINALQKGDQTCGTYGRAEGAESDLCLKRGRGWVEWA